jgi:hypothetical protein
MADLNGALVIIDVHALETGINTLNGPADAVRADVTILDGPQAGDHHEDTLLWGKVLIGQLRREVGKKVLGRVGQGQQKPGQNAPWILNPATDADTKTATEYLAKTTLTSAGPPF